MLKKVKSALTFSKPVQRKQYLDAEDMKYALNQLSKALKKISPSRVENPISIVVAGGTCSVLVLNNRLSTQDIDFFNPDPDILEEIFQAKQLASTKLLHLHGLWINAEMISFVLNHPGCEDLFDNSIKQDHVLYRSDVLIAYAADWKYQLVGKISRAYAHRQLLEAMADSDARARQIFTERNLRDAVCILRLLVQQNDEVPLPQSLVRTWYSEGPALEDNDIEFVNNAYEQQYNIGIGISEG